MSESDDGAVMGGLFASADVAGTASDDEETEATPEARLADRPIEALLVGGALCLLGLAVGAGTIAAPSLVPESVLVTLIGVVATVAGIGWTSQQFGAARAGATAPEVERPATTVPGADFDAMLSEEGENVRRYEHRTEIKRRLRRLLVGQLRRDGHTDAEARQRLDDGTWTDDATAAGLFGYDEPSGGRLARALQHVRAHLPWFSTFGREAHHAVDAAATMAGLDDRVWTNPERAGDPAEAGRPARTTAFEDDHRATDRLRLVGGLVLTAVGLGVLLRSPAVLLAGAVGTSLLAHRFAGGVPDPTLRVERRVAESDPDPGDALDVTVTVENTGESTLFDLRLFDGVPPALSVVEGSPRHYTGLRPGASATIEYAVDVTGGRHEFDPLGVVARSASGAAERTTTVGVEGETVVECEVKPDPDTGAPARTETQRGIGSVVTDIGGSGIEFHSTREYRAGDPLRRIDWRRLARGGDLATLQFNVERSTTVVVVLDTRAAAFVGVGEDSAVERSVGAAASAVSELVYSNDRVGLATLGPRRCWIPPRAGRRQWPIVSDALASNEALTHPDPDERFLTYSTLHWLRTRLPERAQVVFFTPLADDESLQIARRLQARGYPPTIVSPRPTGTATPGQVVAHLEREQRLSRVRDVGLLAVDWREDEPLEAAFDRTRRRWSR